MTKIAFLGLGQMGAPMAGRLLEAGHDVTVWNRSAENASPLADRGAAVASSPAEAAVGVDVAITMVSDPAALEDVVFGEHGLAAALGRDQVLIEMSTVGPAEIRSVGERLPDGVELVDAPVRGSVPQATEGSLAIMVGASDDVYEQVRPILEVLGRPRLIGPVGSGAAMKLVANSTLGAAIAAAGEAIALGDALGLDREVVLDVLTGTALGNVVEGKRDAFVTGSYPARFKLSLAFKDLRLVTEAGEASGRELPLAAAARDWFARADEAGSGGLDYSAVVATIIGERARA
jgi:3-hydroxyisobutyrate dehydrogenase-like beta-hydroxyacid dehydrogenase